MATVRANVPLRLGLVSILVSLSTAVSAEDEGTHRYCAGQDTEHAPVRIKATQQCPQCEATGWAWRKGVERDGQVVLLSPQDLAALGDPATKAALVVSAHPLRQVLAATVPGDKAYYLTPGKAGKGAAPDVGGYRLLMELLRRNPSKAILSVFATSSRAKLWRLQLVGDLITLQSLCWPEDLVAAPAIPVAEVPAEHLVLAQQLLRAITSPFDVAAYRDQARVVREVLMSDRSPALTVVPAAPLTSMVDTLRASVAQLVEDRRESA